MDKLLAPAEDDKDDSVEDALAEHIEIQEESEPLVVAKDPKMPSQSEIAEHNITHWPYRSWCKFCTMG